MAEHNKYASGELPFPPYGLMTDGIQQDLEGFPRVPPDAFRGGYFIPQDERERRWERFIDETAAILRGTLWPEWNRHEQEWYGNAKRYMVAITEKDLHLVDQLQKNALLEKPSSPVRSLDCPKHEDIFRVEDSGDFFTMYPKIDASMNAALIDTLSKVFDARSTGKSGTLHLQLKIRFQRPRPFQTTFLLKGPALRPRRSISAGTPSLPSGHTLQSVLGMGAVIEYILTHGIVLSRDSWFALRQHTVDIGDRRVFAGIHYPADNIASWISVMRVADYVFPTPGVKARLWYAISRQSRVFQEAVGNAVYADAIAALKESAEDAERMLEAETLPEL